MPLLPVSAVFGCVGILDAKNGVHQRWEVSEVDAADRAIELIQRVRFAALQDADSGQVPVVGDVGGKRLLLLTVLGTSTWKLAVKTCVRSKSEEAHESRRWFGLSPVKNRPMSLCSSREWLQV